MYLGFLYTSGLKPAWDLISEVRRNLFIVFNYKSPTPFSLGRFSGYGIWDTLGAPYPQKRRMHRRKEKRYPMDGHKLYEP